MGINRITLIGNVGADAELRHTRDGGAVLNVRLAVGERWKDSSGERKERTTWFSIAVFGTRAEALARHITKGTQLYVSGRMQSREWEKDGQKRTSWEVVADEIEFLGGKRDGGERAQHRTTDARGGGAPPADDFGDDDIPFAINVVELGDPLERPRDAARKARLA
jgi:single-strand DNA-binding protein